MNFNRKFCSTKKSGNCFNSIRFRTLRMLKKIRHFWREQVEGEEGGGEEREGGGEEGWSAYRKASSTLDFL